MKTIRTTRTFGIRILLSVLILLCVFGLANNSKAADSLLQSNSMTYLGAFGIPEYGDAAPACSIYSGASIGFNPNGNSGAGSIFIAGQDMSGTYITEITIPTNLYTGTNPDSLPLASFITPVPHYYDISEGHYTHYGQNGTAVTDPEGFGVGGIMVIGSSILATTYGYYTDGTSYVPMFFHKSLDPSDTGIDPKTSKPFFDGMHGPNPSVIGNGGHGDFMSGALGKIPAAYQSQLGGTYMVGAMPYNMSLVSRTSYGPSIIAFDPTNLGSANTVSGTTNAYTLATYPDDHQPWPWSEFMASSPYYSINDHYGALIMPPGSRTILVVGEHGYGEQYLNCPGLESLSGSCYGMPTSNCAQHRQSDGEHPYCYDPAIAATGDGNWANTAWPYGNYVWAYDVGNADGSNTTGNNTTGFNATYPAKNNLTAVKLGQISPWDVKPYAMWGLPDPANPLTYHFAGEGGTMYASGFYDEVHSRAYFAVYNGNTTNRTPVIEVYQITVGSGGGDTTPPSAPSGLTVN